MVRDGVDPKPPDGMGERSWWLLKIVSCTPLSTWCLEKSATPDRLTQSIRGGEWEELLWIAWATAVTRSRDPHWAGALLLHPPQDTTITDRFQSHLLDTLPLDQRDTFLMTSLRSIPDPLQSNHPAFRMFRQLRGPLGLDLAGEILSRVRQAVDMECAAIAREREDSASEPVSKPFVCDYGVLHFISGLGAILPVALLHEAEDGRPREELVRLYLGVAYEKLIANLRFRSEMLQELTR
jgi:hypothetical protein